MTSPLVVHKGRTNVIAVDLNMDVSADTLTSEIRVAADQASELIAVWQVAKHTTGADGKIILTLDNSATSTITAANGFMDIKRVTGGEPVSIFDKPLEVTFRGTVTA